MREVVMGHYRNRLVASTGALVLAGVLSLEGAPVPAQESGLPEKGATPFGAAEKATVSGVPMTLYAEVWSGPRGAGTITVVRVIAAGEKFPGEVTLERMWYVKGGRRVEVSLSPEAVPAPANERIRWADGVADSDGDGEVDLMLELRDRSGARYVLTAEAQPVRSLP